MLVVGCLFSVGTRAAAASGPVIWLDDFAKAQKQAQTSGRPILADFTGSDWCGWCMKLDKEVFREKLFQSYARSNLVLFVADFPRGKRQAPRLIKQNEALQQKYQVQGFPTLFLLDAEGKVLAQTGYLPGGAAAYVTNLQALLRQAGWTPPVATNAVKQAAAPAGVPAVAR
jgi:protein disulfide-isomerase